MSKINVIIDANFIFHKNLFIAKSFASKKGFFLSQKKDQEQLIRKVSADIIYTLKYIENYDRIIFCMDSHSWRKDFYLTYKAKRIKKSDIDWDSLYKIMDDFSIILSQQNVIVTKIDGAEADDIMYLWSDYLKNKNENSIIITGDSDMNQIVDIYNDSYIICYNNLSKKSLLTCKKGFVDKFNNKIENKIDTSDIFNMHVEKMSNNFKYNLLKDKNIEEINPDKIIFNKIILGDKGDNIPPIYSWKTKEGKFKNVTNSFLIKIYNSLYDKEDDICIDEIINNESILDMIRVKIEEIAKINIDNKKFINNFNRNLKLIYLNKKQIPKYIIDNFYDRLSKQHIDNNYTKKFNIKTLLKNTEYEEKNMEFLSPLFD